MCPLVGYLHDTKSNKLHIQSDIISFSYERIEEIHQRMIVVSTHSTWACECYAENSFSVKIVLQFVLNSPKHVKCESKEKASVWNKCNVSQKFGEESYIQIVKQTYMVMQYKDIPLSFKYSHSA